MKFYYLQYTDEGDEWEHNYHRVFENEDEAVRFIEKYKEEMKDVGGIIDVTHQIDELTEYQLQYSLTVQEYFEIFPGLEAIVNNHLTESTMKKGDSSAEEFKIGDIAKAKSKDAYYGKIIDIRTEEGMVLFQFMHTKGGCWISKSLIEKSIIK